MSQSTINNLCGDIIVKNVLCSNLYAYNNKDTSTCTLTAKFDKSDGLTGLLIAQVRALMGDATYKVGKNSVDNTVSSQVVLGDTTVHGATGKATKLLAELEHHEHKLVGNVDVRFYGVTVEQLKLFSFESYVIKYETTKIQLKSDLHSYVLS